MKTTLHECLANIFYATFSFPSSITLHSLFCRRTVKMTLMKWKGIYLLLIYAFLIPLNMSIAYEGPKEIQRMDDSFQQTRSIAFCAHASTEVAESPEYHAGIVSESRYDIFRTEDRLRYYLNTIQYLDLYKPANIPAKVERKDYIYNFEKYGNLLVQYIEQEYDNKNQVLFDALSGGETQQVSTIALSQDPTSLAESIPYYLSPFFGFFEKEYMPAVFQSPNATRRSDKIANIEAIVIEVEHEWEDWKVWLDPECGYLPRKVTVTRNTDAPIKWPGIREDEELIKYEASIVDVETESVGGSHFLKEITVIKNFVTSKRKDEYYDRILYSSIDRNPKMNEPAFGPRQRISNETPVHMEDAPHLDFVWRDGEIVPLTDEAVEALRGQKFLKGPGSSRFWMFVVGLILIAAIVVTKIYQRRKAASNSSTISEEEE